MKRILSYLSPYKLRITGGLAVKTIAAFCDLGIPWVLSFIIDSVIPEKSVGLVVLWGAIMLVLSLGAWIGNITANRIAAGVSRDTTKGIRHDLFRKISYLSNRNVDNFTVPSLISRMTSDTYIVHQTVGMMMRLGIRAPIMLIGGILITLSLDPVLTLVMVAALPIAAVLTVFISRKGTKLFKLVQKAADRLFLVVRENVTGTRVIKALSKTDYEKSRFSKVNTELTDKERKAANTMSFIDPAMSITLNLGLVAVVLVGAFRVNGGISAIGKIIAFMNYFTLILQSLMAINRMFTMLSKVSASAARISEVFDCPTELYELESKYESTDKQAPAVEFKHVDFMYDTGKFLLKDITFKLKHGETLGIIGATGSGKSTIIQALLRFYDVKSGEILVDGVNIKDYSTKELHGKFGVAFQNDTLFKDTIDENIRFGRELDENDMDTALRIARADDFIREQGGLTAPVAIKGANLSGGQKQRLLIARAVAAKPEILILDDSSSALDYKTDAAMREEIRRELSGSSKIIVAQRISSIMHAETIMVMDGGVIIGIGTHEYLMETCSLYREIAKSQIGGGPDA